MSTSLFEPRTQLNVVPVADRKQVQIFWQIDPLQQRERALLQLRVPLHGWHALLSHRLCEPCRRVHRRSHRLAACRCAV